MADSRRHLACDIELAAQFIELAQKPAEEDDMLFESRGRKTSIGIDP